MIAALSFLAGMATAMILRRLANRMVLGGSSVARAARRKRLAEIDHDVLLSFRDDVEAEIVRRMMS